MQREILFRGKRIDNGEWVYGVPHKVGDATFIASEELKWIHLIPGDFLVPEEGWTVDPETVGQYTGLKDKNGVKIFVGDVIDDCGMMAVFNVYWDTEQGAWGAEAQQDGGKMVLSGVVSQYTQVINNIHDKENS